MKHTGRAVRAMIFVDETDTVHHKNVAIEIVHRAHAAGLGGATMLRGIEGFGAHRELHTWRFLSLSNELPIVVVIIDAPDKLRAFLDTLDDVLVEGLVALDEVEAIQYVRDRDERNRRDRRHRGEGS